MPVAPSKLKALAKQARGPLMTGARGGKYYLTASGEKVYADELPPDAEPAASRTPVTGPEVVKAQRAAPPARAKGKVSMGRVKTDPVPQVKGKPAAGAGAQLPKALLARLKELGVGKLPAAHIAEVHVSHNINTPAAHDGALLKWTDDKGREQRVYSKEFDRKNAEKKWARVMANRPKVAKALDAMRAKAETSPAHAAALLMALTSLRPGSSQSVAHEGHYGATTLEARHIKFRGDEAHLEFVGKQGKVNKAVVDDPALVGALRAAVKGKEPSQRVFDTNIKAIREAVPPGVKLKDLRTIGATNHAERELRNHGFEPTGDTKKDARAVIGVLKAVSTSVAARLNNTPGMARKSYIAPQVIRAWAAKYPDIKPEWVEL